MLPGGMPGTLNLDASEKVSQALSWCESTGAVIGAICAAPSVLGHRGLLKGKKAICYPGFENELEGHIPTTEHVCRDGNIITAKGMGVSLEFGLALLEALKGSGAAEKVRNSLQCR